MALFCPQLVLPWNLGLIQLQREGLEFCQVLLGPRFTGRAGVLPGKDGDNPMTYAAVMSHVFQGLIMTVHS